MLHIRGEKRSEEKREEEGKIYGERFFGSFERALRIPSNIDQDAIQAKLKDGVLEVRLPRVKPVESTERKIQVTPS
jgi:HSP20 family protein